MGIGACRVGDTLHGWASEHSGHVPPHPSVELTGNVYSGSPNVFINGKPAAFNGTECVTIEYDACCGQSWGHVAQGSSKVFVNGHELAYIGCKVEPHSGEANLTSGSQNVFVGA